MAENTPDSLVVHAQDVSSSAGSVQTLAPTTFTLGAGECCVVVGANGSGKSTLLSLVLGQRLPAAGEVTVMGRPAHLARREAAHRLAASTGVMPHYRDMTVREHLDLITAAWPEGSVLGGVDDTLERSDLVTVADQFPGELSSGETQMFALTCAAFRPSDLLVLDEPEQRLDARWRRRVADLLADLRSRGRALLVATHSPDLRDTLADQVVELRPRQR